MKLFSTLALLAALALTGCMTVPATRVQFDPKSHSLLLQSPKDVTITDLIAEVRADGSATITLSGYSSKNNVEAIAAIADANAKARADGAAVGDRILSTAISSLAK